MLPARAHPQLAESALQECLEQPRWQKQVARFGWQVTRVDSLTLAVTVRARPLPGAASESYTLLVSCSYYPAWPPDVRFVNPSTLKFDPGADLPHVARLTAPYCYVHPTFAGWETTNFEYAPQLVCSSMTLGYYYSRHNPTEAERWVPGSHHIGSSIYTVHKALQSEHYSGRHP